MGLFGSIANETPIDDISGLIPRDTVKTGTQLNAVEADNIADVLTRYIGLGRPPKGLAPFDFPWFYSLHREMFGQVWRWAGEPRASELNLGIAPHLIDQAIYELSKDLEYWERHESITLHEQAALLHHRAVRVHPFLNGNGRWSRMLANVWLMQHEGTFVDWPERMIGTESEERRAYIRTIIAADDGDLRPLLDMQNRYLKVFDDEVESAADEAADEDGAA